MRSEPAHHLEFAVGVSLLLAAALACGADPIPTGGDRPMADPSLLGSPYGLGALPYLTDCETRSISAENPTGERGKGGTAIPDPAEPTTWARDGRCGPSFGSTPGRRRR